MQYPKGTEERLQNKAKLVLRVSYFTSVGSFIFCALCLFVFNITEVIPYVFLTFGISNLINTLLYSYHRNLTLTYKIASVLALIATTLIIIFSGGINSPFIFVLAPLIVAGYITTKSSGALYFYLILLIILLIYAQHIVAWDFVYNAVPESSKTIFALLSILFSVYLLGVVFGKNLLQAHQALFGAKNKAEEKIKEKETLLKEVHHRVKNNLQTVSSLLSLQSRNIDDKKTKDLLKNSQNRVISMAMVHEMLYMREDLSKIEYKSYVEELAEYLVRSIKGTSSNITLDIDIPDIKLNIDTAIPLGLLINEAVTNALKYGIVDDSKGEIFIKLRRGEDGEYQLNIGDNGIGFPETVNHKTTKSLGLKLIHNLTRQLRGSIIRDATKKGTYYIVKFKEIHQKIPSLT